MGGRRPCKSKKTWREPGRDEFALMGKEPREKKLKK